MSTFAIVGIVATGLFILVSIAITIQTIDNNKKEKRRLYAGLTARANNFEYMLNGFPEGFLNRNLQLLVCKSLEQVYRQLVNLDSKNRVFAGRLSLVQQQINVLKNKPASSQSTHLTDNKQIQEIQKLLGSLHKYISKLTETKAITAKDGTIYAKQIRRLITQTSLDGLSVLKTQAIAESKFRLAIHYLQMCIEKINNENGDGAYNEALNQLGQEISALNEKAIENEKNVKIIKEENKKEWKEIDKEDESWKKKALYD